MAAWWRPRTASGAARLVLLQGPDSERFRVYRRRLETQTPPLVVAAAAHAAAHLREMHGRLPVQEVVEELAEFHRADVGAVLSYLASLGIGYLLAENPTVRESL